jgi:UDP-N-acetylglucosamine enolpyruvyl transferase
VWGIEHIERGYDKLYAKLNSLGAHVERMDYSANGHAADAR